MILVINIHHGDGVFSLLNQELKNNGVFTRILNIVIFQTCLLSVCFIFFLSKASNAFLLFSTNCINSWIIKIKIIRK